MPSKAAASVRRAMVSGARDYLVKPPRPEELARAIYSVLEYEERRRTRMTMTTGQYLSLMVRQVSTG